MCNPVTTTALGLAGGHTAEPVDAVLDRLNDPATATAMITLLDNAELLSTLVVGLAGYLERSDAVPDDDVDRGMDLLVELARTIGQRT